MKTKNKGRDGKCNTRKSIIGQQESPAGNPLCHVQHSAGASKRVCGTYGATGAQCGKCSRTDFNHLI